MRDLQAFVASFDALTEGQSLATILEKALLLLSDYNKWCQGAFALNAECRIVKINSPDAVAWSIQGAVGYVSNPYGIVPPFILKYLDALAVELVAKERGINAVVTSHDVVMEPPFDKEHVDIGWFNDHYTHDGVMEFMQEALRRCRE